MTTEREQSADLIVPFSGEVLDLKAEPVDKLADALSQLAEWKEALRDAEHTIKTELLSRMDKELARTHQAGDWFLECDAPGQTVYDPAELDVVLQRLVKEDKIGWLAAEQALKPVQSLKPSKRGIDKLLKAPTLTDEDRAEVMACAHPTRSSRRLTVKKTDA